MKTKKWVEAPSYSYEGDDWGEYDGEDEYGVGSPSSAQASAAPTGIGPQGQGLTGGAARSFTNPEVPPLPGPRRAPSFDTGDERRAFSSGVPPGQQQAPPLQVQTNVPAESTGSRQASAASYAPSNVSDLSSLDPRHRSNYSPSAEPPPLQTHHPQPQAQYPPHRTSQNQQRSPMSSAPPSAGGIPPRESTPTSASKPLPFVRPADIYKRMEEEREKERRSMDSQRSTPDIAPRRTSEDSSSSGAGQVPRERTSMDSISRGSGRRTPLDTVAETTEQERIPRQTLPAVAERKSEYGMPESPPRVAGPATTQVPQNVALRQPRYPGPPQLSSLPQLPQFGGDTSFGDEFWESTPLGDSRGPAAPAAPQPLTSTTAQADGGLQHTPSLGFRSMVNQAFDQPARASTGMSHADSQRSLGDSSVSRSDSAATSDISPIMSRVPSSAAGTVKAQEAQRREESTPTIAEEPAEVAAPEPQRHSNATISDVHQIPRKPSPSHSRNSSVENVKSGYRRDLNTPSPSNSPARSPAVEANKQLPDPEVAELAMNSPVEETGAQIIPDNLNAATREAEVAPAANTSEMESRSANAGSGQNALEGILESSNKGLPEAPMEVELRPESPSKGKVRDLAEKFDAESRKNSPAGTPRSSSPVKPHNVVETALPTAETSTLHPSGPSTLGRPAAERELSFRPQLPGQWQSFATTATEQSEDETAKDVTPVAENERTETTPTAPQHEIERTETEKTPTSPAAPIQSLADESSTSPTDHPIAALAAAGAAMGEAIKKSVGLGETETESPKSGIRAVGDVYSNRPMAPDRMESEISTIPPASPEKENPEDIEEEEEDIPPPVPLKERSMSPEYAPKSSLTQVRPAIMTNMSTDDEPSDLESDRLRKEIVRTLSPIEPSTSVDSAQQNLTVDAGDQHAAINRDSSILPSIYDSYLGSEKEVAPVEHSHATLPEVSEASEAHESFPTGEAPHFEGPSAPNTASAVELEPTAEPSTSQPPLMKRFSWEMDDSKPDTPVSPTYPEVVAPAGAAVESQAGVSQPGHETPDNPRFSGEGLHVINAEPGEIPHIDTSTTAFQQIENSPQTVQHVSPVVVTPKGPGMATSVGIDPKFPSFREIMAVKSPDQRIVGFNSTREQWAGHDSGLGNWLASTLAAHPEHANAASFNRPIATPPSGARHKPTSSISRAFTKQFSPISSTQSQQQSVGGTSQEATPISGQRTSGTKGKDLLEKAGVLGGKGMTGAKGLFAKGRSKFRGSMGGSEKVD